MYIRPDTLDEAVHVLASSGGQILAVPPEDDVAENRALAHGMGFCRRGFHRRIARFLLDRHRGMTIATNLIILRKHKSIRAPFRKTMNPGRRRYHSGL